MTPKELIETAQFLNPEKTKSRPAEALQDALAYTQALQILNGQTITAKIAELKSVPQKDTEPDSIIDQLQVYRKRSGLSVSKLAEKLKVASGTLYFWMDRKYTPSDRSMNKIAEFLHANQ
jgi:DNA-binding XRE family transcriptional regulator